jgi:hypothetical protein
VCSSPSGPSASSWRSCSPTAASRWPSPSRGCLPPWCWPFRGSCASPSARGVVCPTSRPTSRGCTSRWAPLWLAAYLGDLTVMGFAGLQCLLTAAHFPLRGLRSLRGGGPSWGGRSTTRATPWARPWRALYTLGGAGLLVGVPLLAAGIAVWRPLEHVAAWDVALATAATGLVLVRRATRPSAGWARGMSALAGLATLVSATLALQFAAHGFARLGGDALARMVRYHGLVNALGFVGCALVAFAVATPKGRAAPRGVPFSRLAGALGEAVGARFFQRAGVVDNGRATGLMVNLEDYARDGLDTAAVSPAVRHFYEHTRDWELVVVPAWQPGWRLAGRIWKALAGRMGQLNLPWDAKARRAARDVAHRAPARRPRRTRGPAGVGAHLSHRRGRRGRGPLRRRVQQPPPRRPPLHEHRLPPARRQHDQRAAPRPPRARRPVALHPGQPPRSPRRRPGRVPLHPPRRPAPAPSTR